MLPTVPDRLSVNPEVLRAAAGRFEWAGNDLQHGLRRLEDSLAALGDVCGGDEAGRAFAADHDAARHRVEVAVANLAACVGGVGRGLRAMADNLDGAEQASTIAGPGPASQGRGA